MVLMIVWLHGMLNKISIRLKSMSGGESTKYIIFDVCESKGYVLVVLVPSTLIFLNVFIQLVSPS